MQERVSRLIREQQGAVAPTVALSLFALIAAGGIAFDYARLATMDTELQNAADQAALAAASQLDGDPGACARAAAAAANLISNRTLLASTGSPAIAIANEATCDATGTIRFWQDKNKTQAATNDENAKFVEVQTSSRTANYTLTPVVAAFAGHTVYGQAFASLGEAICRVPPLMLCNPDETNDPDFTIANYIGKGVRLIANDGGGNYTPGNFGFLDVGQGNGANSLRAVLGRQGDPGDCSAGGTVTTEPGNMISVRDALNTRFDIYDAGLNQACGNDGSLCPPSINSRKDLIRKGTNTSHCGFGANESNNGWRVTANIYPPTTLEAPSRDLTDGEIGALMPMGYPRDKCHSVSVIGDCTGGRIGDGAWDRFAYFKSHSLLTTTPDNIPNYPEVSSLTTADTTAFNTFLQNTFGTTNPSRFQVYEWESTRPSRLKAYDLGGNESANGAPICSPPGVGPSATQPDRRLLSVAVVNCQAEAVQGKTTGVEVTSWVDIFLVEPSVPRPRAENSDVYVEIVRETPNASGNTNVQTVKKSVPYLIE